MERKVSISQLLDDGIGAVLLGAFPPLVVACLVSSGLSKQRAETIVRWGKRKKIAQTFRVI
jgi:hypothetical protein